MKKNIIDIKQYKKIQKLLAGSSEDKTLGLTIIDNCDIAQSFLPILCLMSQFRNKVYAYGSELGQCQNLVQYICELYNQKPDHYIIDLDLHWLMTVYKIHRDKYNLPEKPEENKFIINEYQTFECNPLYSFKAQLNPKKKI